MKISRLRLHRAPGLEKGLGEHRFEAGLNVVFGPNESGKSTLARVIQSTLWPEGKRDGQVYDARSEWEEGGVDWSARFDGETEWQREGEPGGEPLLPPRENATAYRLHLRDLIAGQDEDGDAFAARVRAALDGGYDLTRRVTEERSRRFGVKEKNELAEAERELRKLEGERADLARRYDDLVRLEAEQHEADRARTEVVRLERVLAWLDAKKRLGGARTALEADPTPDLEGHEAREIARLDDEIERCGADRDALAAKLDTARERIAEADLPQVVPDVDVVASWLDDAHALDRVAAEAESALAALAEAGEAEAHARHALAASAPPAADAETPLFAPTLDDVEALAQWLELRATAAAARRVIDARRARLDARTSEQDRFEGITRDVLVEARRLVVDAASAGAGVLAPLAGAALAGAGVAIASWQGWIALAAEQGAAFVAVAALEPNVAFTAAAALATTAALAGAGVGLVAGRAWRRRRLVAQLNGLDVPDDVVASSPSDLLDALQGAIAHREREADATRERGDLDADLAELERGSPELEARRRALIEGFGIDPGVEDLTLVTWARRIQDHERATAALARARANASSAQEQHERAHAMQAERVRPFAAALPTTPAEIAGVVHALQKRIDAAKRAREEIDRCTHEIEGISERRDAHVRQRDELLERLGLAGLDHSTAREKLNGWMDGLEARRQRQADVHAATAAVAEHARALEGDAVSMQLDEADVVQRLERARERESEANALRERLAALKREVELAEGSDRVEVALAHVNESTEALEARRLQVFEGVAARLLFDDVSEQIGTRHRPEVLSRATELFGLFTRHRYELEVASFGDQVRFVARATETNERKQLGQLSDGTRMQLLLAARLAFVHDGERGVRPPLVLDEALSSSDAARMTAMTDALVAEAQTGRQIFYMTNDPGDVASWRVACERAGAPPPNVIALGEAQREAHAERWAGFEPPEPLAPVPPPGGLDAAGYRAALGVPLPDPWAPLGELHLYHLLSDDLELLYRVLDEGHVERLGHFESRRRAGTAEQLLGAEVVDRVGFRALVAERFFDAWRRGRGRPLRPGDLEACEELGDTFKPRVAAVAEAVGGDAAALVERIVERDSRLKGLGKRRVALETFLYEQGFLAQDDPLEDDALVAQVSAGIGEALFGLDRDAARARLRDAESLVRLWSMMLAHGDDAA